MTITLWLEELRDDVSFAFRQLRAAPAFTLVATLTLALDEMRKTAWSG
jgi:hypothetical protein